MNHQTVSHSIIKAIIDYYAVVNEAEFFKGNVLYNRHLRYMTDEQKELLSAARDACDAALKDPLRHFTGGFGWFSPY